LWRQTVDAYDLRVDERAVLENACRVTDTLARLDAALVDAPLTVAGSMGQQREHPLLSEARQQRALLGRLLAQLRLPDADDLGDLRARERSVHARRAAQSRWAQAHGAS
jgi:hypothetical protein